MAVGGPWRFVAIVLAKALAFFSIGGVIELQLAFSSGRGDNWGNPAVDADALVVGEEAEEIEEEVGGSKAPIAVPLLVQKVLDEGMHTRCSKRSPMVAMVMMPGRYTKWNILPRMIVRNFRSINLPLLYLQDFH